MRQAISREFDPGNGVDIATLAYDYPSAYHVLEHAHGSHQLIYATTGVMEIRVGQKLWLIPPQFAIWIPARTRHSIRMTGPVSMRTLYLRPRLARHVMQACAVIHVPPLLRELIIEIVRIGKLRVGRSHRALTQVLLAQLEGASAMPTCLTMPQDERAAAVAAAVVAKPGSRRSLRLLCSDALVGVRTIERLFRRDVGVDFETWRRQLRLMKAMELLIAGKPVKEVAFDVGYRQPSAFIAMFRRTLGTSPSAWTAKLRAEGLQKQPRRS